MPQKAFAKLPSRYQNNIEQAVMLFRFLENKENMSFSPVFTPCSRAMEDACNTLILARLQPTMPIGRVAEKDFFNPILSSIDQKKWKYYQDELKKLERTLVFRSPISPMGHLKFCLEYAIKSKEGLGGVFNAIRLHFGSERDRATFGGSGFGIPIQEQKHRPPRTRDRDEGPSPRAVDCMEHGPRLLYEGSAPVIAGRA